MNTQTTPTDEPLFSVYSPLTRLTGILSIPHSGEVIPNDFLDYLTTHKRHLIEDLDTGVDRLVDIDQLREKGVAIIVSNISRIAVDLNRSRDLTVLNWKSNSMGEQIVVKDPQEQEISRLREKYYTPYFEMLKTMISQAEELISGPVSFVDLHSMPSKPTAYHLKINPKQEALRPDFCLSDRHGQTCSADYINFMTDHLIGKGYNAKINTPYIGGYITEYINNFRTNNIQIEINRALYLDEKSKKMHNKKSDDLKKQLTHSLIELFQKFSQ